MNIPTALTGFIVPKCKVYGNGFFSEESNDPDNFKNELRELKESLSDPVIEAKKAEYEKMKTDHMKTSRVTTDCEVRDGRIVIHRRKDLLKNFDDNTVIISPRGDKRHYTPTYRTKNGIKVNTNKLAVISSRNKLVSDNGLIKIHKKVNPL